MASQTVKQRPLLFSGAMVRAIYQNKTQTRRTTGLDFINENPGCWQRQWVPAKDGKHWLFTCGDDRVQVRCPYGVEGDQLWVRETCRAEEAPHGIDGVRYVADDFWQPIENTTEAAERWEKLYNYGQRRGSTVPPIHMPRWASRLLLEITAVRCERLQDISEADAAAEGVESCIADLARFGARARGMKLYRDYALTRNSLTEAPCYGWDNARQSFQSLWVSINGAGSWGPNPWVWVVEFKIVTP